MNKIKITWFPEASKDNPDAAKMGKIKSFDRLGELHEFIKSNAWSPILFKDCKRSQDNFTESSLLVFDIDEGLNILDAAKRLELLNVNFSITLSKSHQATKNDKPACDRFRIVVPHNCPIFGLNVYKTYIDEFMRIYFPEADLKCADGARYFFPSSGEGANEIRRDSKESIHPAQLLHILYDVKKIRGSRAFSKEVLFFWEKASTKLPGTFNDALNKFSFSLAKNGWPYDEIEDFAASICPLPLDDSDLSTILSGFNAGQTKKSREKNLSEKLDLNFLHDEITEDKTPCNLNKMYTYLGKPIDRKNLVEHLYVKAVDLGLNISHKRIDSYLIVHGDKLIVREFNKLKENIKYCAPNNELKNFVHAITEKNEELTYIALYHWIWMVKRKLHNLEVENHLMPVLVGKTGSGKSRAISLLIEPLRAVTLETDLSQVCDPRCSKIFTEKYIVLLDEMANAKRADFEILKSRISSAHLYYRAMFTNDAVGGRNNSSYIGTSNIDLCDIIQDPTSARRYYQIDSCPLCDWTKINEIDYLKLWTGVNENIDSLLTKDWLERLQKHQATIRHRDAVEDWLDEVVDIIPREEFRKGTESKDCYDSFKIWMEWQNKGHNILTHRAFSNRLKKLIGEAAIPSGSKRYYPCRFKQKLVEAGIKF